MKSSYKIIKDASLLDSHTIVKIAGYSFINDNAKSIKTTIKGHFFLSRLIDKGRPSYNWLDFFTGTIEQKLTQLRKTTTLGKGAKARFVELNVGIIRQKVRTVIPSSDIIHDPTPESASTKKDDSHCVMTDIPYRPLDRPDKTPDMLYEMSSAEEVVGIIISRNITNTHPAREPI